MKLWKDDVKEKRVLWMHNNYSELEPYISAIVNMGHPDFKTNIDIVSIASNALELLKENPYFVVLLHPNITPGPRAKRFKELKSWDGFKDTSQEMSQYIERMIHQSYKIAPSVDVPLIITDFSLENRFSQFPGQAYFQMSHFKPYMFADMVLHMGDMLNQFGLLEEKIVGHIQQKNKHNDLIEIPARQGLDLVDNVLMHRLKYEKSK